MPTATPILAPGATLGDGYVVERSLGGGGMGQVYLARDLRLDRLVAIKLLHAEIAASDEAEARFRREARALSRVLHPNVVGIHAFGRHAETWYLVMEYVEGRSLEAMLQEGALTVEVAVDLTRQIAAGLAEAHALGIVHRDIKPGNVLLRTLATGALLAKVADFGLARSMVSSDSNVVTRDTAILGTPAYMAPEQIQAQKVDGRADLYALAVMFYQMLTGHLPYQRETMQAMLIAHLIDEPPPLTPEQARSIPAAVDRELRRALSKRPEDRHASVTEFALALDRALGRTTWSGDGESSHCPGCGNSATGGGFCVHCGSAVPAEHCTACGTERAGERYDCEVCGASLLQGPSSSSSVLGSLRPSSAALLLARLGDVQGAQLAELAETFVTAVAREGGRTLALIGADAVAVFGLGGMREGDTARAVDAALAMTARHPATSTASLRAVVDVGALVSRGTGITWGMALLAGEVVERARAACQKAPPGTVVVGDAAWRDCRGLFEVRSDGRQRQVLRRRDALQALGDYMNRDPARPFVGRAAELAVAQRACRRVRRDQGLLTVAVVGPSEVGKSRMLGELLRRLETTDDRWRFELIRCSPLSVPSGWQPLAGLVRDAVVSTEDETVALRVSRLPGIQEDDSERSARRAQALLRMLGMDDSEAAEAQAPRPASDAELAAAFEAWVAVVRGLCRQQPMALVVEDLQYAKPMLLQLLAHLARSCADLPLALILPLRPDRADPVLQALQLPPSRVVTVELERL
ncbi:MAG: protein kinase [Deltaproteobacteria bacterium]|nr:protein kinase [Deltaproteobacteria bacterium]